jgi:hypothetical protein
MAAKAPKGYRQYGTYRTKNEAMQVLSNLRKKGHSVNIRECPVKSLDVMYRVFIKD